jgi:hypothetical protein
MSKRPASCKLAKSELVFPILENSMNSLGNAVSQAK